MLVAPIQNVPICNEDTVVCNCVCVYFYNKQKKPEVSRRSEVNIHTPTETKLAF